MTTAQTDQQLAVHEFLTARGWHLDGPADPATARLADDPNTAWRYPATFGGRQVNKVAEATPVPLHGYFTFDAQGNEVFALVPAGNDPGNGCPEHDTREQVIPFTRAGTVDFAGMVPTLDTFEARARDLDPRALIECLYFGPCKG
jgi:hypothetical protein